MRRMFSKKEIEEIALEKLKTSDVKAKTLEQSEYNYDSGNIELNPNWLNGVTATKSFLKFVVINKVFYVVISLILENETENDIAMPGNTALITQFELPEAISSKIYRKDGTTLNQTLTLSDCVIGCTYRVSAIAGASKSDVDGTIYSSVTNRIGLWAATSLTIPAGATRILDFRTQLIL